MKILCNGYEKEHNNEFNLWKNERGQLIDYKSRIDKAIEYIKEKYNYLFGNDEFLDHDELVDKKRLSNVINILKGDDNDK